MFKIRYASASIFTKCHTYLCTSFLANADSIPKQIFELEGANDQILNFQTSDLTTQLWEIAHGFKKTASDHRLGLPRVQNSSLKKTLSAAAQGASSTKKAAPGISKGVTILQEMQDAREQGKKVKFTVLVYKLTPKKGGVLSMVPVGSFLLAAGILTC